LSRTSVGTAKFWIICAVLALAGPASAQENVDAKQVVGKWVGTLRPDGAPPSPVEVEFKPDGAFEGETNSGRFGPVSYAGRWKTDGKVVLVDYTARTNQGSAEVSWALEQNGKELSGTGRNKTSSIRFGVSLRREK